MNKVYTLEEALALTEKYGTLQHTILGPIYYPYIPLCVITPTERYYTIPDEK